MSLNPSEKDKNSLTPLIIIHVMDNRLEIQTVVFNAKANSPVSASQHSKPSIYCRKKYKNVPEQCFCKPDNGGSINFLENWR